MRRYTLEIDHDELRVLLDAIEQFWQNQPDEPVRNGKTEKVAKHLSEKVDSLFFTSHGIQ